MLEAGGCSGKMDHGYGMVYDLTVECTVLSSVGFEYPLFDGSMNNDHGGFHWLAVGGPSELFLIP